MNLKLITIFIIATNSYASLCKDIIIEQNNIPHLITANIKHKFTRELPLIELNKSYSINDKTQDIIIKSIQPFGFMNPEVSIRKTSSNKCEQIYAKIRLGHPTRIISIKSNVKTNIHDLRLKTGSIFTAEEYNKYIRKLHTIWQNKGYRDVDISKSKVLLDPKKNTAEMLINIELGKIYRIGKIKIKSDAFARNIILKYITFKENEPYSVNKLQNTQENLMNSGYFKNVEVKSIKTNQSKIPIEIITKPTERIRTVVGIGYDNVDSLRAIFNSRIIVNKLGHIINSVSNFSKNNSLIQIGYNIPSNLLSNAKYIIQTSYMIDHKQNDRSLNFSARYSKKDESLSINYGLNAIHNQQKITNKIITNMLYPFFNISRKFLFIVKDYDIKNSWAFSAVLAKKNLASNIDLVQARSSYYSKVPLNDKYRFILSGQIGVNYTSDPQKQPLPTLLTLGGNNGLRGYPLNSIINRNDQLQILRAISFEIQRKISGNIYGTAFIDLGQVSPNFRDPWYRGVGIGAVYSTVIGDINISIAKPLDLIPEQNNRHFRLAISYSI